MAMFSTYSLADIRNGVHWPDGVRFTVATEPGARAVPDSRTETVVAAAADLFGDQYSLPVDAHGSGTGSAGEYARGVLELAATLLGLSAEDYPAFVARINLRMREGL